MASLSLPSVHQVFSFQFHKSFFFGRILNDLSFLFNSLFCGIFLKRPHLVVSQTSPPGIWWVGFLLSQWYRTPWIHISKDIFPDNLKALNDKWGGKFLSLVDHLSSFPIKKSDRILVIGEDMKKRFLNKGIDHRKIFQSHDWVDLEFIRPLAKKNTFSETHHLVDKFVVLYAGNFGRIHNFEDLLSAAEELHYESQIVFLLVGEGALKEKLIHESQSRGLNNILIVPFEVRSKLPEVLASADVSVILLKKGMAGLSVPSKIYSILASGRPIIACVEEESDIAGMVRDSQSGFVVPPGNPHQFAAAVKELFSQLPLRSQLGANARRYAEEKDFRTVAFRDYERLFNEILVHEKTL